jgi:hypothetical protein
MDMKTDYDLRKRRESKKIPFSLSNTTVGPERKVRDTPCYRDIFLLKDLYVNA